MATGDLLNIWNRALGSIGARASVQNSNENTPQANACNLYYQSTYESLARTAHWGCLLKQIPLTLLAAAPGTPQNQQGTTLPYPPVPWRYAYLIPPDSLYIRQLVPPPLMPATAGSTPIFPVGVVTSYFTANRRALIPYEIGYWLNQQNQPQQVILTNLPGALCNYTTNAPNPQMWDSLFQTAMVASLAAFLVATLATDKSLMAMQIKIAEAAIMQARVADGNEIPTSTDNVPDWIAARSGSGGYRMGFNTSNYGYDCTDIIWPG